jgi:capsular polysaccharide transport system permease protein
MSQGMPIGIWQELAAGWRNQNSVISALILKDFKNKTDRGRLGLMWLVLEPMVMVIMMSAIWYLVRRQSIDGVHVVLFITSGMIMYTLVRRSTSTIPSAVKNNASLLNYPQVKPLSCILARFVFEATLLSVAGVLLYFLLWWFLDLVPTFNDPVLLFQVLGLLLLLCLGISIVLGVYGTLYDVVGRMMHLLARPLFFTSGVIHSLHDLPGWAREYILWNPIVHLVDHARAALYGITLFPEENLTYPFLWAVGLVGFGLVAYYVNRFRLAEE